ncbi:GNAT family N-acetyltransferase [Streptomyces tsukubensis]|uniref:GNAT family N-acetyltransferase n=1 Tax=Streptomyces tsukubensis TaxID=83656 RepID=A0A1V4AD82_9ACTN|nr:GNAT family N-acetyltransferase [Streptomyces tsukubensis]
MQIRTVTVDELPALQDLERAAGEPFRALGMAEIADDAPPSLETLDGFRREDGAWVASEGETGEPLAYLLTLTVDGAAHIEQVSVHPKAARRGLGAHLIAHLADRARDAGLSALTLTTFAEVPWNAPYYARLGFRVLAEAELTPALRAIREEESALGLDRWRRLAMRKEL